MGMILSTLQGCCEYSMEQHRECPVDRRAQCSASDVLKKWTHIPSTGASAKLSARKEEQSLPCPHRSVSRVWSSDLNSASASHIGSTRSCYFLEFCLVYYLINGFECSVCCVWSLIFKKNLCALSRDNLAIESPVMFLLLLPIFYVRGQLAFQEI